MEGTVCLVWEKDFFGPNTVMVEEEEEDDEEKEEEEEGEEGKIPHQEWSLYVRK